MLLLVEKFQRQKIDPPYGYGHDICSVYAVVYQYKSWIRSCGTATVTQAKTCEVPPHRTESIFWYMCCIFLGLITLCSYSRSLCPNREHKKYSKPHLTIFELICWFPGTQKPILEIQVTSKINGGFNHPPPPSNLPGYLDFQY